MVIKTAACAVNRGMAYHRCALGAKGRLPDRPTWRVLAGPRAGAAPTTVPAGYNLIDKASPNADRFCFCLLHHNSALLCPTSRNAYHHCALGAKGLHESDESGLR